MKTNNRICNQSLGERGVAVAAGGNANSSSWAASLGRSDSFGTAAFSVLGAVSALAAFFCGVALGVVSIFSDTASVLDAAALGVVSIFSDIACVLDAADLGVVSIFSEPADFSAIADLFWAVDFLEDVLLFFLDEFNGRSFLARRSVWECKRYSSDPHERK